MAILVYGFYGVVFVAIFLGLTFFVHRVLSRQDKARYEKRIESYKERIAELERGTQDHKRLSEGLAVMLDDTNPNLKIGDIQLLLDAYGSQHMLT